MAYKFIYDSIHKQMEIHATVLNIINTPPFQRLRYLKQLSVTDYVFPTASHSRFEHSVGVSHLAGKMIRSIKHKQPELDINDDDILKVEIAGLCHDLGHGPFSHTFDKFLETKLDNCPNIEHENRSCMLLTYLVDKYNINISQDMLIDIIDLIHPHQNNKTNNKPFLYHIISNSSNGIDVDKFDYLKRDTFNLGLSYSIDLERLIETARVIDNEICYPEKMLFAISNIFQTRGRLHKEVYNHPVVQSIELMIFDFLEKLPLDWDSIANNPEIFLKYTDNILTDLPENDSKYEDAIEIRNQIWKRDIYKYIDQIILPIELFSHSNQILNQFETQLKNIDNGVKILCLHIGYGENPISKVKFYNIKKSPNMSYYLDEQKISPLLPTNYEEKTIRFYITDKKMESIGEYYINEFRRYCESNFKTYDDKHLKNIN